MSSDLGLVAEAALVGIVAVAFATEATIGFGATLLTLALGSFVAPVDELLHAVVPLNVALSAAVAVRSWRHIDGRALGLGILPAMAVGFPIGVIAFERLPRRGLQTGLGIFVMVLGVLELVRLVRAPKEAKALPRPAALALLFLGGMLHGAFGTGGPPVVYVCGRTLPDKRVFRATLAALWLLLGGLLVAAYARGGHLGAGSLRRTALLVPGLALGLWGGEVAHGRLPERAFRRVVFGALVVVGAVLVLRA
jgi:uncharacterized protein